MSRTPWTPRRTAIELFDRLSTRKISPALRGSMRELAELLGRMPLDGHAVRILPCAYAERVLNLSADSLRLCTWELQRLGCITGVIVAVSESIGDPIECYIVARDGMSSDLYWNAGTLIGDLRAARDRCFAPSTPTPEVSAA